MPWHLANDAPGCSGWAVILNATGKAVGCHETKGKAQAQLAALNIHAKGDVMGDTMVDTRPAIRPPRDGIVRALPGEVVMRGDDADGRSHMVGRFAVFNEWAEIDSVFEGHFMERVAQGAFTKTFSEHTPKVLFQHGADPELHHKPLGLVEDLREDATGAVYDVALFRGLPPLLLEGLAAGAYGSSFKFRVMRERLDEDAEASDHNPDGLPERTITEADVFEFGPVTFPAYAGATAGIRSLTDEVVFSQFAGDPERLVELIDHIRATRADSAHDDPAPPAAGPRPTAGRREPLFGQDDRKGKPGWMLT